MNDILLPRGRHANKKLEEVPRDYLEWLSTLKDFDGHADIPDAAKALLATMPQRPLRYSIPRFIEDAEKLVWMAGKGNREARRTMLAARGEDGCFEVWDYDDYLSVVRVHDDGTGYVAGSREQIEETEREEAEYAKRLEDWKNNPHLEWTAGTGQQIKVWCCDEWGFLDDIEMDDGSVHDLYKVSIDDGDPIERIMDEVPKGHRRTAKAKGIVAILGSVGLTAETQRDPCGKDDGIEEEKIMQTATITKVAGQVIVRTPWNESLVQEIRNIPGRRWNSQVRAWFVPAGSEHQVRELVRQYFQIEGEYLPDTPYENVLVRVTGNASDKYSHIGGVRIDGVDILSFVGGYLDTRPNGAFEILEYKSTCTETEAFYQIEYELLLRIRRNAAWSVTGRGDFKGNYVFIETQEQTGMSDESSIEA
jgi:hypothetical protein